MDLSPPIPVPTPTSQPFWDGLKSRQVRLQRCDDCDTWIYYPRTRCSACLSEALSWHDVSGEGVIYTYTVTHQPTSPHFADELPQRLAVVELDEGVRLTSTLTNVEDVEIAVGMRVRPVFDDVSDDVTLLRFEPA